MSTFVIGCSRAYRCITRAFPHQYRAICGDGLEQLGEDVVPRVWQQHGVAGMIRLFADLAWHLPCEYVNGEACAERPQAIIADGRRRPLLDLSGRPIPGMPTGAITFGSKPDRQTLELGAEVDGQVLIAGRYEVSADGKTLTVTNKGTGPKGGPFEVVMVMERVAG